MKFISAGHCNTKGMNYDPGAGGVNNRNEALETLRVRNRVVEYIKAVGYTDLVEDLDNECLREYLARIKPGEASVVVEFHFNAFDGNAHGTEVVVADNSDRLDIAMATEFSSAGSLIMNISKRSGGLIKESDTPRKRLGLMRETGIVSLVEVCFIDNADDMHKFDANFDCLCQAYANIIIKFDNLIP